MLPEQFKKLELIERLSNDRDGAQLKELLARLNAGKASVRKQLDAGVSPQEYQGLTSLAAAYDAALAVLPTLWEKVLSEQGTA